MFLFSWEFGVTDNSDTFLLYSFLTSNTSVVYTFPQETTYCAGKWAYCYLLVGGCCIGQ